MPTRRCWTALWIIIAAAAPALVAAPVDQTAPPRGLRDGTPNVHALVGARIVVAPGRVIEKGTIVVRDGVIAAVGAGVAAPPDARVWDMAGKTVYAGFIDPYSEMAAGSVGDAGAPYWNPRVAPQLGVADAYKSDTGFNEKLRSQGVVARLVAPGGGIIKGTSAVVTTGDGDGQRAILKAPAALHVRLWSSRAVGREQYPNSPMGAMALARQAMYDAQWYAAAWSAYRADPALPRPQRNDALDALAAQRGSLLPVIIDAADAAAVLRADRYAREFDLPAIVRDGGSAYRRLDAIAATGRTVIVPVDFPKAPDVSSPELAASVSLRDLMHWDIAPENPARLAEAGVTIALTGHGLKDAGGYLEAVRQAVRRGLEPDAALAAMTTAPAKLLSLSEALGTVEAGKAASFVVTDGDLFEKKTKVVETWVDGVRYEIVTPPLADVRGTWRVTLQGGGDEPKQITIKLTGQAAKPSGAVVDEETKADETDKDDKDGADKDDDADKDDAADKPAKPAPAKLSHVSLVAAQLGFTLKGDKLGAPGVVLVSVTVRPGQNTWAGGVIWPDGRRGWCTAKLTEPFDPDADKDEKKDDEKEEKKDEPRRALFAVNYPLGAFGRDLPPDQPRAVAFTNATVWTCGPAGVLENATVVVRDGKITAVRPGVQIPADAKVIDCQGRHLTPGLIDAHSHIATDSGVNESAQAVTAEVRIGDFIEADDIDIYRQLAGGVTTSHILHGSANPIGGQSQVLKFRWGALPEQMKFDAAAPTIKFALGENVKQSNWGEQYTTRYPQSRMGVEQLIGDEFAAARDYQRAWAKWNETKRGVPPRRDLELDAIVEILEGKRIIHCHSYRQDEMLALIRVCDKFGVKIGTLQHVLEGYKIADDIKRHGAMGSSFSDWWAYKFEVYDAIPYNGAIMHDVGVVVSFNSDSAELARRLNTEAAKAAKYGGVSEAEALKFVTLNPARQLKVEARVGSLEAGKDADIVIWSGPPLSVYSRCEQTWVDGRKYFDREEDLKQRQQVRSMRSKLIQRILDSGAPMASPDEENKSPDALIPRFNEFCGHCRITETDR